jgi:membrane protein implicated in regulation of membrane protease activity
VDTYSGQEARVVVAIKPDDKGRICLHGVYWPAKTISQIRKVIPENSIVIVVARRGLTLFVRPKCR